MFKRNFYNSVASLYFRCYIEEVLLIRAIIFGFSIPKKLAIRTTVIQTHLFYLTVLMFSQNNVLQFYYP